MTSFFSLSFTFTRTSTRHTGNYYRHIALVVASRLLSCSFPGKTDLFLKATFLLSLSRFQKNFHARDDPPPLDIRRRRDFNPKSDTKRVSPFLACSLHLASRSLHSQSLVWAARYGIGFNQKGTRLRLPCQLMKERGVDFLAIYSVEEVERLHFVSLALTP